MGNSEDRNSETRKQLRLRRHGEYLTTALRILTNDGLEALTMQRLADELDCAVGAIYRYYPSKNALLAEMVRDACEVLHAALVKSQAHLDDLIAAGDLKPDVAALTRAVGAARFWLAAEDAYPRRIDLLRRMYTDPRVQLSEEDGARVLLAVYRLLDLARALMDDAVEAGALGPGSGFDRAMIIVAGSTGVLLITGVARWDESLFEGRRLADEMTRALFLGWGADPDALTRADELLGKLSHLGQLVPMILEG